MRWSFVAAACAADCYPVGRVPAWRVTVRATGGSAGATVDDNFDLSVFGTMSSPDLAVGEWVPEVRGVRGWLGRGGFGMRAFVPVPTGRWGWTLDAGVEVSHLQTVDTTTVTTSPRNGEAEETTRTTPDATHRATPLFRVGGQVGLVPPP